MDPFIMKEPLIGNTDEAIARVGTMGIQWPYSLYQFRDVRVDYKHVFLAVSARWTHRSPSAHKRQAPVHRLPVELIGTIFEHYLKIRIEDHEKARTGQSMWKPTPFISTDRLLKSSPMLLGQVCGYWRDIALSMPTLWSSICISCPQAYSEGMLPTLGLWLERSGTSPLTLYLASSSMKLEYNIVQDKVLTLLIPHVHRWNRISFSFINNEGQESLASLPMGAAKMLESVSLSISRWDRDSADRLWHNFYACSPLRQVDWQNYYTGVNFPSSAPWKQLTRITLGGATFEAIMEALPLCSAVIVLRLSFIDEPVTTAKRWVPITLPNLMTLSLRSSSSSLFNYITLPALTTLEIAFMSTFISPSSRSVDFLERSSRNLKNLSLREAWMTEDKLIAFLEIPSLASVVQLEVMGKLTDITASLLTHRVTDETEKRLFPELEDLCLRGCSTTPGILSSMVVSRIHLGCDRNGQTCRKLKRIEIGVKQGFAHDIPFLKTIREEGLVMNLPSLESLAWL